MVSHALTIGPHRTPTAGCSSFELSGICGWERGWTTTSSWWRSSRNDDTVFCRYRQTATGKASGASVEVENGQVITFRDGKVIRTDVYSDPAEAARAAGARSSSSKFAWLGGYQPAARGGNPRRRPSRASRSSVRSADAFACA